MMMIPKRNSDFDLWSDLFDDPFFSNHETKVMRTDIKEGKDNYVMIRKISKLILIMDT